MTYFVGKRVRGLALAALAAVTMLGASGVIHPQPAHAWWRGGVWYGGPGPGYYGPRPYYAPPPVFIPPPPVYYAPPPVYYAPPPPVYYAPPPPVAYGGGAARTCFAGPINCAMTVPRTPGAPCYCTNGAGGQSWGSAH